MRIRNLWFELLSFFTALFMFMCAVSAIVGYLEGVLAVRLAPAVIVAGFFLFLGIAFFWQSLQLGDMQRRRRELRKKQQAEKAGHA